jgi:hypothetical protein
MDSYNTLAYGIRLTAGDVRKKLRKYYDLDDDELDKSLLSGLQYDSFEFVGQDDIVLLVKKPPITGLYYDGYAQLIGQANILTDQQVADLEKQLIQAAKEFVSETDASFKFYQPIKLYSLTLTGCCYE